MHPVSRIFILILLGLFFQSCSQETVLPSGSSEHLALSDMPAQALTYVQTTFAGLNIVKIEKKYHSDGSFRVYEVYLENGTELYFDINWNPVADDNGSSGSSGSSGTDDSVKIPFGDLPQAAQDYVNQHYPGMAIKQVKKRLDDSGAVRQYEVRFESGLRIYFNAQGQFTGIKD